MAADSVCPRCGKELSASPGTPPQAVKSPIPRVLAILLVGIFLGSVLGAAAVYVVLSPPAPSAPTKPASTDFFSNSMPFGTEAQLGGMSSNLPIGDFLLRMRNDTSTSAQVRVPGNITTGAYALVNLQDSYYAIFFRDRYPMGQLDVYDQFLIAPMHGTPCPTARTYLDLLWMDGSPVTEHGVLDWNCAAGANFTLGPASPMVNMANGTLVSITAMAGEVLPMNLMVRLQVGSTLSSPMWMTMGNGTGWMMSGSTMSYGFAWEDRDAGGTVNVGDRFSVTTGMMMSPGVHMTLYILGRDGSQAASVSWTT